MSPKKWLPLFIREGNAAGREKYEALVAEPSIGLLRAIVDYVAARLVARGYTNILSRERAIEIEQALDIDLHPSRNQGWLDPFIALPLVQRLSVVDYCIHHYMDDGAAFRDAAVLREAMERARFVYTVDLDERCLARVLIAGVQETVEAGFGIERANTHLREAVHWATGLKPDALKSFDAMVRAIEAVVKPALAPKDTTATLGKLLGQIRNDSIVLSSALPRNGQASPQALPTAHVVRGMMELIWSGYERHGGGGAPPTAEEARALLGVAGSVVVWFGAGIVKKGP